MIGNKDWFVTSRQNIVLVQPDDGAAPHAVPYDFDMSSFVFHLNILASMPAESAATLVSFSQFKPGNSITAIFGLFIFSLARRHHNLVAMRNCYLLYFS